MLIAASASGEARFTGGLGVSVGFSPGNLPLTIPAIRSECWMQSGEQSGWGGGIDLFLPPVDQDVVPIQNLIRTTLWGTRWATLSWRNYSIKLASGVGWGVCQYQIPGRTFTRGVAAFRVEGWYPLAKTSLGNWETGVIYLGNPWPGTGYIEDGITFAIRLALFGRESR